jgi:hypothetical protein
VSDLAFMAEGEGFEPPWACALTVFKTAFKMLPYAKTFRNPLGTRIFCASLEFFVR